MMLLRSKLGLIIILAFSYFVHSCISKPFRQPTSREAVLPKKIPCAQDGPFKQFRNSEGTCSVCTNCSKVGLMERRPCTDYQDMTCRNKCINRDDQYNHVTRACEKPRHRLSSATTVTPTTSKSLIISSRSTPLDLNYSSSGSYFIIPLAIPCSVLVFVGVVVVMILILKANCEPKKENACESVYASLDELAMQKTQINEEESMAEENETSIPDTDLRYQRVDQAYNFQEAKNKDIT